MTENLLHQNPCWTTTWTWMHYDSWELSHSQMLLTRHRLLQAFDLLKKFKTCWNKCNIFQKLLYPVIAYTTDKTKLWLSPCTKRCQNPCSGPPTVYQDLNKRHDWPIKLTIRMNRNSKCSSGNSLGSFSNDEGESSENVKKAIGLISKTTALNVQHTFLYISLPSQHDYSVKMPNFTFYGGRKQVKANFSFSFKTWVWSLRNQLQGNSPTFDIFRELE